MTSKKKVAAGAGLLGALSIAGTMFLGKPEHKSLGTPIGIVKEVAEAPTTVYTAYSNPPGGIDLDAGTALLSHRVVNLRNGTSYTFTVVASNEFGSSPPSAPSLPVTPDIKFCAGLFCDGFETTDKCRWSPACDE